jgi:hypothetical protein
MRSSSSKRKISPAKSQYPSLIIIAFLATAVFPGVLGFCAHKTEKIPPSASDETTPVYRNTAPGVAYSGSHACAQCHQDIYETFRQTGMGRSMSPASEPEQPGEVKLPVTVFDKNINRYFKVYREGSDIYQGEHEADPTGKQVLLRADRLAYAIGAGELGVSYLIQHDDRWFEAPLSFYSKPRAWELSPGYQLRNQGFNKLISDDCILCHNGRPLPERSVAVPHFSVGSNPPFSELAIGCENCHGPGQIHVSERLRGAPLSGPVDTSIVNPAKLPGWLANEICMICHQGGDARVLKPGKGWFDFRPGTPLDQTLAIFQVPLTPESAPPSPLLGAYFGMILSQCYLKSGGRLECISCHDPHIELPAGEAPAHFRSRCLGCHTEKSCKLSLESRLPHTPSDDCASCHMQKPDLKIISHAALTDHRIVAKPGEHYPESAFQLTNSKLPDLVHLDAVPDVSDDLPAVTLLEAYANLAATRPATYQQRYLELLDQIQDVYPDNLFVLSARAKRVLWEHKPGAREQASQYLFRAVELGTTYSEDYLMLGQLLAAAGRPSEAADVLKHGLSLAPHISSFYSMLASQYLSLGQYPQANEIVRKGLNEFPDDGRLRELGKELDSSPHAP